MQFTIRALLLFRFFALMLVCTFPLTGCGSNIGTPSGLLTRAVTFKIQWGKANTSDPTGVNPPIFAPSAAQSAILRLQNAQPDGSDLVYTAHRSTASDAATQQSYPPILVRTGPTILIAEFYLQADPKPSTDGGKTGDIPIGKLTAPQTVKNDTTTEIVIDTEVAPDKVVVKEGQTVAVGHHLLLEYTASLNGVLVPVATKAKTTQINRAKITVTSLASRLSADNDNIGGPTVTGIAPGKPTVTVTVTTETVDGDTTTTSDPVEVTVTSIVLVKVTPATSTVNVQTGTVMFHADVSHIDGSTDVNPKVLWSILEGDSGGTINPNTGVYKALTPAGAPIALGTYHIIATSQENTDQTGMATITVTGGSTNVHLQ